MVCKVVAWEERTAAGYESPTRKVGVAVGVRRCQVAEARNYGVQAAKVCECVLFLMPQQRSHVRSEILKVAAGRRGERARQFPEAAAHYNPPGVW